ncbi:hypothetical protein [Brevibacterium zhoupengii]|uniref:hypothetical protein n=1 Tax=Brevibacterium zhoupengii TaxID=2898795 RepID=UPI001E4B9E8C|nr:hypothetical protein [Brevibacterium zhoupengii]
MRIVVTSLGDVPRDLSDLDPKFVIIWSCLLACVISAWLVDRLRIWAWVTVCLGVAVLALLINLMAEPPSLMWDGQDSSGRWIGGMEVASPAWGAALWAVGGLALIAAGICGLIGECQRSAERQQLLKRQWSAERIRQDTHSRLVARQQRTLAENAARLLPLMSLASWIVMIWVPIMDNQATDEEGVTLTSLGFNTTELVDMGPGILLAWTAVILSAAVGLTMEPPAWWSAVVVAFGVGLYPMLVGILTYPPAVRWRGETASGESISANIIGFPAAGVSFWALGSITLIVAGISGLLAQRQRRRLFR